MHDKVSRLRQLMAEAVPKAAPLVPAEEDSWSRYHRFAANSPDPIALDDSDRARAVRHINRIATWHSASSAVIAWLDKAGASGIGALDDDQVFDLRDHMQKIEDCVHQGFDSPYTTGDF